LLIDDISVVIIAKNADETIYETLVSLLFFKEVILYLNDSTDNTQEISKEFKNVKIYNGEFIGFGPTKNSAVELASNSWILSLDSDEVLPKELIENIKNIDLSDKSNVYMLCRYNYFLGKRTRSKDQIVRLYNKTRTKLNSNLVHEKVIIDKNMKIVHIKPCFKHLNITDINQTITKMLKYTDLASKDKKTCFFIVVIAKSFFSFFQSYILRFGFLDGWVGFTIAITNANRRFYKYLKRYINCQK
jgi:glycosyltransferase involved in cell wall biosynthesis